MIRIKKLNVNFLKKHISLLFLMIIATSTSIFSQVNFKTNLRYCLEDSGKVNARSLTKNISIQTNSYSDIIKADMSKNDYWSGNYFAKSIFNYLFEGKLTAYSIGEKSKLTVSEIKEMISSTDTVITFNPVTFEEKINVIVNSINYSDCGCYKIEQSWSQKGHQITSSITGIIPIINTADGKERELFWIPINQVEMEDLINNPSISWVKLNKEYMPNDKNYQLKKIIWDAPKNNKTSIYVYDYNPLFNKEKLEDTFFNNYVLNTSKDTVITFNPETSEENMSVYERGPIGYEDVKYLSIVQLFYINDVAKSIGSKLIGLAPLKEEEDPRDSTKYVQHLYQIIFDEKE